MTRYTRSFLVAIVLLGALSVIAKLVERVGWDNDFRKVLLVFDGDGFAKLQKQGVSVALPSPSALSVNEVTIKSLTELDYIGSASGLSVGKTSYRVTIPRGLLLEEPLSRAADFYSERGVLEGSSPEKGTMLEAMIWDALSHQLVGGFEIDVSLSASSLNISLELPPLSEEERNRLSLGFYLRPEVAHPEEFGYVFRPSGNGLFDRQAVLRKLSLVPLMKERLPLIIFQGDNVLGYPNSLSATAEYIDGDLGIPEFSRIEGLSALAHLLPAERIFWLHTIPPDEIAKMSLRDMGDRYLRALKERNPRILYIHPVANSKGIIVNNNLLESVASAQASFLQDLVLGIRDELGYALSLDLKNPPRERFVWLDSFILLLAFLSFLLFIHIYFPQSIPLEWLFHPAVLVPLLALFFGLSISNTLVESYVVTPFGLLVALVSPLLGLGLSLRYLLSNVGNPSWDFTFHKQLRSAFVAFSIVFLTSLAGGLIVFAIYHSPEAFTKMEVFKGVILSRILPPLVALAYCYDLATLRGSKVERNFYHRLDRLFGYSVKYLDFLLFFLLLLGLGVAVMRSGNEFGFLVTETERSFRSGLENLLGVRPRNTEIVGYASMLFFFTLIRTNHRSLLVLLAIGMLGMTSLVNTFSHFHSPLLVSVLRASYGLVLSLLLFLAVYLVLFCFGILWKVANGVIRGTHKP